LLGAGRERGAGPGGQAGPQWHAHLGHAGPWVDIMGGVNACATVSFWTPTDLLMTTNNEQHEPYYDKDLFVPTDYNNAVSTKCVVSQSINQSINQSIIDVGRVDQSTD
jgi:hypothetical protein